MLNPPDAAADISGVPEPAEAQQTQTQEALISLARLLGRQIARELHSTQQSPRYQQNSETIKK